MYINNFGQASLPSNWRPKLLPIKHYTRALLLYGWQMTPLLQKDTLDYFKALAL